MTRSLIVKNPPKGRNARSPTTSTVHRIAKTATATASTERMPNPSIEGQVPMDIDVDSSEYETDSDAEPEEFYVSLDFTIPTPIHAGPSSNPHTNSAPPSNLPPPRPLSSTTRSGRTGRRQLPKRPRTTPPSSDDEENPVSRWAHGDHGRLQILDLHTENPLLSFGNRIWSGSWTATVGTEIYVRCPEGPAPEDTHEVRGVYVSQKDTSAAAAAGAHVAAGAGGEEDREDPRAGQVIATAGVRLHCLPAVLTAKQRPLAALAGERTYGWRPGKSSFLDRLEEIQIAKGEKKPRGEREGSTEGTGMESETDGERGQVPPRVGSSAFQNRVDASGVDGDGRGVGRGLDTVVEESAVVGTAKGKERAF
ncbi:hypothetical protein P167DRAFT_605697 [Morchella conica CCBAS932]|uniref:Transcription factor TFIIIC triple barrel domain-containing protein n=1 Tax=Morchella conica CCBAS932 TaxID=1392247 RepID=A0A3N4KPV4_9PEZI|nr:hypothetical protein P167DRAFT_605697 [Morchella conica CCBAS932]